MTPERAPASPERLAGGAAIRCPGRFAAVPGGVRARAPQVPTVEFVRKAADRTQSPPAPQRTTPRRPAPSQIPAIISARVTITSA
jgi:hypothetical protein